jgi:hypothetical protein
MTRTSKAIAFTLLAFLSIPGLQAAEKTTSSQFNYNYVQLGYVNLDNNLDGIAVAASHDVAPEIAIDASYATTSDNNLDYDLFSIGASYHGKMDQINNADMALHLEYVDSTIKAGNNKNDDNGLRVGSTLRYRAQPNLELFGDISFTNLYENDLILTSGILLHFDNNITAMVTYEASEIDAVMLGVRLGLQ